jgi:Domain of unknown function (DUF3854)
MNADVLSTRHRRDVLNGRAISDEVINAQPDRYRSFERRDFDAFSRLMRFDLPRWRRPKVAAWKSKVSTSGGIVIKRFDARGSDDPPPYARFDEEVCFGRGKWLHYAYPPRETRRRIDTKVIDAHPLTRAPGFADRDELYFCLEGSLKADAVLSAGQAAISSSSVTTWQGKSLRELVPMLKDDFRRVYVVADSDFYQSEKFGGYFNPNVVFQARAAGQYLRNRGLDVKVAIPWTGIDRPKVGVDDFLHQGYRHRTRAGELGGSRVRIRGRQGVRTATYIRGVRTLNETDRQHPHCSRALGVLSSRDVPRPGLGLLRRGTHVAHGWARARTERRRPLNPSSPPL